MPQLSLSSNDLNTTLSPNEASFITGVFSDQTPQSSFSAAQAAVDEKRQRLRDDGVDEVVFLVPGTQVLIFPIGMIITGVWTVLGVGMYGWGTVERWRFRETYRERVKRLGAVGKTGI